MPGKNRYSGEDTKNEENSGEHEISILELYYEIKETRKENTENKEELQQDISHLKQKIHNGLEEKVGSNEEKIQELCRDVTEIIEIINKEDYFQQGKLTTWKIIVTVVSSTAGGVLITLTILSYLGFL